MANFNQFTSGFKIGNTDVGILAAKISTDTSGVASAWPTTTEMSTASSFVPTIGAVEFEINAKISTVYKVKGTHNVSDSDINTDEQITNLPENPENGDVWNIHLTGDKTNAKIGEQEITDGDNIVWVDSDVETSAHWDKLAGSIDVTKYATKDFVSDYISDNTLKTAEDLSGIDSTTSGKLVNAGAISGYIKDQIDSTIQETIDIAEVLTSGMSGTDSKPASAVPNASAVTAYINTNTIKTSAEMTANTANSDGLVSNDAIKSYVSAQLAGTNAYGQIIVNNLTTSASRPNDVFKVKSGSGVTVATSNDDGHPTIKFNSNISISGTAGSASSAAEFNASTTTGDDGKVNFAITVPDATNNKAGVVKADYYDQTNGLIYLF